MTFIVLAQGNHIIIRVPMDSDTVWLDCTMNDSPFGFLDDFTDDRAVLLVNKEGGTIGRTPEYDESLNSLSVKLQLDDILADYIDLNLTLTNTGINYNILKAISKKNDAYIKDYISEYVLEWIEVFIQ